MSTTPDGSSAISETKMSTISFRDGGCCVLCGDDPVDVAHIVARKAGELGQVPFIRSICRSLSTFKKDDGTNLICLCGSHHRQYDSGHFVFVPCPSQRKVLLDHERIDFEHRESLVANGQQDPGRTLPSIFEEKEYIPIHPTRFHPYVHTPTRYDPTFFLFDTQDSAPCLPLHFQADPICIMVHAQPYLANVVRLQIDRAATAQREVTTLLELYNRVPGRKKNSRHVPAAYEATSLKQQVGNLSNTTHMLPTIPGSTSNSFTSVSLTQQSGSHQVEMPGLTLSSSATTMDGSAATEVTEASTDVQLLEYTKERAVTWEDLKNRPPIYPGVDGGDWQFSSAEEIIRGEWC